MSEQGMSGYGGQGMGGAGQGEMGQGEMAQGGMGQGGMGQQGNFLNAVGTDGSFGNEDSDKSMLAEVGRAIAPAFSPLGLDEENWPAAVGIFTGVLAKEAVVGTLDAAYTALAAQDAGEAAAEEAFSLT